MFEAVLLQANYAHVLELFLVDRYTGISSMVGVDRNTCAVLPQKAVCHRCPSFNILYLLDLVVRLHLVALASVSILDNLQGCEGIIFDMPEVTEFCMHFMDIYIM